MDKITKNGNRRKLSAFDLLPEETRNEGIRLVKEYRYTNLELCQLLDTDADLFEYVPVSEVELSARITSALTRHEQFRGISYNTVGSILHATVYELLTVRNLSVIGVAELLIMTKRYVEKKDHRLCLRNVYDSEELRQRRLGHALICLMKNKDHTDISYNRSELAVIEKYKYAVAILGSELCSAAFSCKKTVYDIIDALYLFSLPRVNLYAYVSSLEKRIHHLPENIMNSHVRLLSTAYYMTNKKPKCSLISNLDRSVRLLDLPQYITTEEIRDRDTVYIIDDLLDWLELDFSIMRCDILKPVRDMKHYDKEILRSSRHSNKYARLSEITGMSRAKIRSAREALVQRIAGSYKRSRYDVFTAIYLYTGKTEITYGDLCSCIGEEAAGALWRLIRNSCSIMKSEYYSLDRLKCTVTINEKFTDL